MYCELGILKVKTMNKRWFYSQWGDTYMYLMKINNHQIIVFCTAGGIRGVCWYTSHPLQSLPFEAMPLQTPAQTSLEEQAGQTNSGLYWFMPGLNIPSSILKMIVWDSPIQRNPQFLVLISG